MYITQNDTDYIKDDIYNYKLITNVISYEYVDFNKWSINADTNNSDDPSEYYLIIETTFNEAFSHWVYECAIYLPLFNMLKVKYPNIKLHIKSNKQYKKLFCNYFNINSNNISNTLISSNICIFPMPISALNDRNITDDYKVQVKAFIKALSIPNSSKTVYNLLVPRGSKENYAGNHRTLDTTDIEKYFNSQDKQNYNILYVDNIDDISKQISIINSSKNIFIVDGGAFLVNSLFANKSNIIVLGDIVLHNNIYCKNKYIYDLICKNNNVTFIPYIHGNFKNSIFYYNDIKEYIT